MSLGIKIKKELPAQRKTKWLFRLKTHQTIDCDDLWDYFSFNHFSYNPNQNIMFELKLICSGNTHRESDMGVNEAKRWKRENRVNVVVTERSWMGGKKTDRKVKRTKTSQNKANIS